MTNVDFYVVRDAAPSARLTIAAKLVEKASARGHSVFINAQDSDQAETLGKTLWSFRGSSFLPHSLNEEDPACSVCIGHDYTPAQHSDILINLALAPPAFFSRFNRVLEVVSQEPKALEALRNAWRFYKDRGYPLKKHDL